MTNSVHTVNTNGMEVSVKNHTDAMIFHTAICAAGVTNSKDHRAELDIRLAIPSAQAPAEWRLV